MSAELTDEKRDDLSLHLYAMDGETSGLLLKISGLAMLADGAMLYARVDEPTPAGIQETISVIHDLAQAALKRAGCA